MLSIGVPYPYSARAGPLDQHLLAAVELHSPGAFRLAGVSTVRCLLPHSLTVF
jgi:hypothetical protein